VAEGNGDGAADRVGIDLVDVLELRYDRVTGLLDIGGKVINADVGLAICNQAARHFEQVLRLQAAQRIAQQTAEAQRVQSILDRTRGGRV
jgi:hypothetical protein